MQCLALIFFMDFHFYILNLICILFYSLGPVIKILYKLQIPWNDFKYGILKNVSKIYIYSNIVYVYTCYMCIYARYMY